MDISLDDTVETSESTDTSNYEDKNENNNAKDTDKEKKLVDSGREMCPIDSKNIKDLSSELSENKNSRKTDESQPVDSGGEMRPIDSQKNEKQLDDFSFENSEIESPVKPVETHTVEENKQELLLSDRPTKNLITTSDGSFKNENFKVGGHSSMDKEGDSLTLEAAPSLSSLMDGSSGYAYGMRNISLDLNRDDNRSHEAENIVGSSVSYNMVAREHRPGPSSTQEYHDDQMSQGVYPIGKPDSFDFKRVQDESSDQYHWIGQVACEQETYCDQQFPRVQRSSSPSGITHSDPGHVDGVDTNITNAYKKKKECIQDVAENAQLTGHQIDSGEYSNQMSPCCSVNSVTHIEEEIYRRHPARLPTHVCQEPCIDHDCPTNNAQIYTYPASSEKEDKIQRSSRCEYLPVVIPQSNATNCNIQRSGMGR